MAGTDTYRASSEIRPPSAFSERLSNSLFQIVGRQAPVLRAVRHHGCIHDALIQRPARDDGEAGSTCGRLPRFLAAVAEIPKRAPLEPWLQRHCSDLAAAEGIVVVHPNWWGQPPAILTGWIDRVVRPGVAYEFGEGDAGDGIPTGLLRARTAVVLNTSNTPASREQEAFGDPLESIWKRCVFDLCGVKDVRRRMYAVVVTSTPEERRRWLADAADLVTSAFPRFA